ncbi:class I SAM-dependent methyltransferase [Ornithinibacillus halophilus]|uniref:Methyltransferase domain-containing protein n=1 Tax=Ornithinibacillus halophilus TaxID=930117 RepID=A0A1M5LL87_9BACI|nr:class I SAM-dependent methyltransferase [Ornithinibacillus halophilus]SHG65775.1 Methyltransferase domain-containing protein [Ornithinibacillus halophilus]
MTFKNHWDERFADVEYVYGKKPNEFIKEKGKRIPKNSKVACFAEGEGRNGVYLAKLGHHVTTYDLSSVGLAKANQLAKENNVEIKTIQMNLTQKPLPKGTYDAGVMVFGHVPKEDQRYFFENMVGSIKNGGILILEVYSDEQFTYKTGGPETANRLYNPMDILNWIKDYKCLHFYYGEADRIEGKRHTGIGHVIQAIIKK